MMAVSDEVSMEDMKVVQLQDLIGTA